MGFEYSEPKKVEKQNITGIPDSMKKRFESFSAMSFDDVRVHYNSNQPAKLNALAYTQGTQVYIAPGQDKYLPHELGHVVQQKQGRVRPTGRIKGLPVNEDTALETEADNFLSVGYRYNKAIVRETKAMEGPVQMVKGEADSIFDFEKLKEFIIQLINKNSMERQAWIGLELNETELDSYTEKVQTLLEDIRQVDLHFLAVTTASFEEEGLLEDKTTFGNVLTDKEQQIFGAKADLQNMYKSITIQKLIYMKKIKEQLEAECNAAHRRYLIAVANHRRARKPKTVRSLKKVMDRLKQQDEKMNVKRRYLADIKKQINTLEAILKNGEKNGYVFNLNSLLMDVDDKIKFYMAIVAPSKIDKFKDISLDEEGNLISFSRQMQLGIGTPVRAFSWYLKYLMDPSAAANNTPLIRSIDMPAFYLQDWHQNAVSEAFRSNDNNPMNEDQKVPNQFGTPASSNDFITLLRYSLGLTTIGEADSIPEKLREGSSDFEEFNQFKTDIGFTRLRDGVITPTDVHFFDFEHTAFHSIKDNGSPGLYSPENAKKMLIKYNGLMDSLIAITGRDEYIEAVTSTGMINEILSRDEIIDKITTILEANHCLLPNREYDLHGNSQEALEAEKRFASDYIGGLADDQNSKILLNLTKERYIIWYNKIEELFNNIVRRINERMPKREKNRIIENARTQVRNKTYLVTRNGGILYELQEIEKIDGKNIFTKLPAININPFFEELEEVFESSQSGKLHVIAFCFKLIRLIKENNPESGQHIQNVEELIGLEGNLFAERCSGDYFDALNRHEHGEITINGENINIPFDKMTSTIRFKPKGNGPRQINIPFIGGASGTTRDISRDLLSKDMLQDEDEYWRFQMLNASFMILYSYHSFVEVIYRAATTRIGYFGEECISKYIIEYLENLNQMPENRSIMDDIKYFIENKHEKQ